MTKFLPFFYDNSKFLTNQKCFIITGENIAYLTAFLNSSLFKFCYRESFPELLGGTRELSKIYFDKLIIKKVDSNFNKKIENIIMNIQDMKAKKIETKNLEIEIDNIIYDLYNITNAEKEKISINDFQ